MSITMRQVAGRLITAVPVPFGRDGAIHEAALKRYASWMAKEAIGGVAIWAHTGRGLRLTDGNYCRDRFASAIKLIITGESSGFSISPPAAPSQLSPAEISTPSFCKPAIKLGASTYCNPFKPALRAPSTFSRRSSTNTHDAAGTPAAATAAL
jgi:4-hydroxy-tetrahydrodipicolinate synthase